MNARGEGDASADLIPDPDDWQLDLDDGPDAASRGGAS